MTDGVPPDLAEVFRRRYGELTAGLCRVLGPQRLDLVEDVVQEAMLRAVRTWPGSGVPERPEAWLFRVARNLALDTLRRHAIARRIERELQQWAEEAAPPPGDGPDPALADDTLRMMFTCSHPAVPANARLPLVLKTVGGFGTSEIAAALLLEEPTVAQRLVRAKAKLQAEAVDFAVPTAEELPARLPLVLEVLYLLGNEGYRAHRGAELVRPDLLAEAIRLLGLLLDEPALARPEVHALAALLLFQAARLPARTDELGEVLTLAQQDRRRWDRALLQQAFHCFRAALGGPVVTAWHVEAAIASLHAAAPDYAATDWAAILREYDRLQALADSPVVRLNRAVAVAKVRGAVAGLRALDELADVPSLQGYCLLPATAAHMHWQLGDHAAAAAALQRALAMVATEPEARLLQRRLQACRNGEPPPAW